MGWALFLARPCPPEVDSPTFLTKTVPLLFDLAETGSSATVLATKIPEHSGEHSQAGAQVHIARGINTILLRSRRIFRILLVRAFSSSHDLNHAPNSFL